MQNIETKLKFVVDDKTGKFLQKLLKKLLPY